MIRENTAGLGGVGSSVCCLHICWREGNAILCCVTHANCTIIEDFVKQQMR